MDAACAGGNRPAPERRRRGADSHRRTGLRGESSYGNSSRTESVWNGTFYSEDVGNGWEYDGETLPKYVVRVTDTNGDVWTEEMPLSKR